MAEVSQVWRFVDKTLVSKGFEPVPVLSDHRALSLTLLRPRLPLPATVSALYVRVLITYPLYILSSNFACLFVCPFVCPPKSHVGVVTYDQEREDHRSVMRKHA